MKIELWVFIYLSCTSELYIYCALYFNENKQIFSNQIKFLHVYVSNLLLLMLVFLCILPHAVCLWVRTTTCPIMLIYSPADDKMHSQMSQTVDNGAKGIKLGWLDGGDGEHNGVGFIDISETFETQDAFFFGREPFAWVYRISRITSICYRDHFLCGWNWCAGRR